MHSTLQHCQDNIGAAPRQFSMWQRMTLLRVPKPRWLQHNPEDQLNAYFRDLPRLFTHGRIAWGAVIMANRVLFEAGRENSPAAVVFCPSGTEDVSPKYLSYLARMLYSLAGTEPVDKELIQLAQGLSDEMSRQYGLPVPMKFSPIAECFVSTTLIVRNHLPNGVLSGSCLPFLVNDQTPSTVTVLPSFFWPEWLAEQWEAGAV